MASNKPTIAYDYSGQPAVPQSIVGLNAQTMFPDELLSFRESLIGNAFSRADVPVRQSMSNTEEYMNIRQGDVVFTHVVDDAVNACPIVFSAFDGYSKGAEQGRVRVLGIAQTDQATKDSLSDNMISVAAFGAHHTINTGRHHISPGDRLLSVPPDVTPENPRLRYGHRLPNTDTHQRYVGELYPVQAFVKANRFSNGVRESFGRLLEAKTGGDASACLAPLNTQGDRSAQIVDEWHRIDLARRLVCVFAGAEDDGLHVQTIAAAISRVSRSDVFMDDTARFINTIQPRVYGVIAAHFNIREFWDEISATGGDMLKMSTVISRALDQLEDARNDLIDSFTIGYSLGTAEPGQQIDMMVCKSV